MPKREFLLLAHQFNPNKHLASGAFASEKLDGFRCFWDGGVSRGRPKSQVPWANLDKDDRFQDEQIATGLWSRYGNVIHAPDFWLDQLPKFFCDGELWMGRGTFQELRSVAAKLPENRDDLAWRDVTFKVFDIPNIDVIFSSGKINTTNFKKEIQLDTPSWVRASATNGLVIPKAKTFRGVMAYLKKNLPGNDVVQALEQEQLPFATEKALDRANTLLNDVTTAGGEGLILRRPDSIWLPERSHNLVKMKKLSDSEATVVGYVTGRRTDKGSKLLGLMGAMLVDWNGIRFELSGFTDDERVLSANARGNQWQHITELRSFEGMAPKDMMVETKAFNWALQNPSPDSGQGSAVPDWISNPTFPRGSQVTFRYRELSDDGVPKEARYWRTR